MNWSSWMQLYCIGSAVSCCMSAEGNIHTHTYICIYTSNHAKLYTEVCSRWISKSLRVGPPRTVWDRNQTSPRNDETTRSIIAAEMKPVPFVVDSEVNCSVRFGQRGAQEEIKTSPDALTIRKAWLREKTASKNASILLASWMGGVVGTISKEAFDDTAWT